MSKKHIKIIGQQFKKYLKSENKKTVAIYARVSLSENKDNLERQKERLISYCDAKGYKITKVVTEIDEGYPKLEALLCNTYINTIVVERIDGLCYVELDCIQKVLAEQGRTIEFLNPIENGREETIEGLVRTLTTFISKVYGLDIIKAFLRVKKKV